MGELIKALRYKPNFYAENGASVIQIEQAEKALGLNFSLDFKDYIRMFGTVSFDGHELTGVSSDENLDVVKVSKKNWQKNNVEKNLYVIEETHIDGIIIWQGEDGVVYATTPDSKPKKIANSLVEYIDNCQ